MIILVTGAAGFIGGTVVRQFRAQGHEVRGLDAYLPQAHGEGARTDDGITRLDLRYATDDLGAALAGVDVVCHQAALVGMGVDAGDLPEFVAHNALGTARLLAAMHTAGVRRLVQASSMVVYGDGAYRCPTDGPVRPRPRRAEDLAAGRFEPTCPHCGGPLEWQPVDEDAALRARSAYAVSKLAQEQEAEVWAAQAGSSAISLRYHNVYGPGMPADTPYAGVAAIWRSAVAGGRPPRVFEDGGQYRDFVHVDDVARANLAAVDAIGFTAPTAGDHRAFNIASGRPRPIRELAAALGAAAGLEPLVVGGGRAGDVRHIVASPERATRELGFTAQVGFADGVAEFVTAPLREGSTPLREGLPDGSDRRR